nr:integrase, catalytic region, zinc finger, CCHC-type, peptidase aspartic, catalytic [Tanacetum cinerariifolium]
MIFKGVERCKKTIAKRTYFGHIDPFIQNTIEANFGPEIQKINADLEKFHLCLNEEMVADLRYFNSFELEVDSLRSQLETQKTQFLNEIDRLSREYYYADHMNAILGVYTELDVVTNLQCDYLETLEKCECLEKELSKSKIMSKSFEALQKHAVNLEIDLQQCQEKIKNDKSFKVNQSKEFCKEREQYFKIQDLKAQLQDKGIAINELKKLIEQLKGKYVDTKFEKSSVIRQPNAFKSQRPSILGKPTIFSDSLKGKISQSQRIDNDIYSTVDACPNACEMWKAIERNKGKAVVNSPKPIYDQEPSMVAKDDETSKDKEIDKLMALISLSFKKIYIPTNNNLRTSSNTSRANQDNSLRINRSTGYENQRIGNVVGARETVGSIVVYKYGIQCYNCKEFGHVARECQKPKRVKDAAYHMEKMLLCKQEEAGIQLNAEQADWRDDISPNVTDPGPIFDTEPLQKVSTDDHYNVFAIESEHPEQSEYVHDTYPIGQDEHNVIIDSLDMSYDREHIDQNDDDNDLANERELLASLIEKLKCEIDDNKNRIKFLETSNKVLVENLKGEIEDFRNKNKSLESSDNRCKEANNKLSKINMLLHNDFEKSQAELARHNDVEYASKIKLYKTRKDKELDKVITLENKVKVLDNIVYKTGQSVQMMNMINNKCRTSFTKPEFLKKAQRANPHLYDIGCYNDNLALMLAHESDEVIRLEKESRSKLSDLIKPFDYDKLNNLYDLFVPQREKSYEQRYFSERSRLSHTPINNGNSNDSFNKQTTLLEKRMDESIPWDQKCKSSIELFKIKSSVGTIFDRVERCKETIAKRTYFGHIDPFIKNTIEANFSHEIRRINAGLEQFHVCLNEELVVDLRYFNSLKLEVDSLRSQLKTQKTQFLNDIDRLSREYYYADHMNAILGVIPTTRVSRPQLKSNPMEDRVLLNNSKGKKQEVEDQRRNVKLYKNKTSVIACNDSLNAKSLNVNFVCAICVYVSSREPKCIAKQFVAKPLKKTVASESNQKPRNITRKLYERVSKLVEIVLFIVDSGCSKHMMGNLKLLINFVEKFLGMVKFRNDQISPIVGYGDLVQGAVTIKRVYYVEGLNHNLFSVGQFCDADLEVAFWKSTCYIRDLKGNDLLTGSRGTDLYSITLQDTNSPNPICLMAKATSSQAWSKDETPEVLINFLRLVQRGLHAQVRIVRIDKGTEFLNQTLHKLTYMPVDAGTNSTNLSGTKDAANQEVRKNESSRSSQVPEGSGNPNSTASTFDPLAEQMETLTVESPIPTVSSPVPTACLNDSSKTSSEARLVSKRVANQEETPSLDNILSLTHRFDNILGVSTSSDAITRVEVDISNMETSISASLTPTLRIHKDHAKSQIIGPVDT